jgi:hypothetical protein
MMKSFIPCLIFWSTALIRALTVASITGAKNLITTGFIVFIVANMRELRKGELLEID